ncbi:PTS sugar transporter subunit IIB [Candidatus Mycoplasma pogonae]
MKIACVCGSGLGSSLLMEMNVKSMLDKLKIDYETVEHTNISSFNGANYNFIVIGADVAPALDYPQEKMVVLTNILSLDELETKLKAFLKI